MTWLLLSLAALTGSLAGESSPTADRPLPPGWAGADLAQAQVLAREANQPILVLVRGPDCPACDQVENLLARDAEVAPLTEPYIRLLLSVAQSEGRAAAALLHVSEVPTVLLMGPGGMEATRREVRIDALWLREQLAIVQRRHAPMGTRPQPGREALLASLARLQEWGDLTGSALLRDRLHATAPGPAPAAAEPARPAASPMTLEEMTVVLDRTEDPGQLRQYAHELALALEADSRPGMSLQAYRLTVDRLLSDPLSESRAAFLAARHNLGLPQVLSRLEAVRLAEPGNVAVLMAEARVAEELGRVFKAFHAVEAAALYAPEDAWVQLELHRLRLVVKLRSRDLIRDPA